MTGAEQPLVIQYCLSTAWGGLEMVAYEMALKMRADGIATITVGAPDSPLTNKLKDAGLRVETVKPGHKYFSPSALALTRRLVKNENPRAILIQQMADLWHVAPALAGYSDLPVVAISHTLVGVNKKDALHEMLYGRVDRLVALTPIHRDNLAERLPFPRELIEVIPNAVNARKFRPQARSAGFREKILGFDANSVLIGVVSRLDRAKGLIEAVRTAAELKARGLGFKMAIVGEETANEPGTRAALEALVNELGLTDCVVLIGPRSDIEVAMASFDILLMPSPAETFGRVVIEAMASGVPVVASAGGGVPGIVLDGVNGLLFPPLDVSAMARALDRLGRDPEKRRKLAEGGLQSVRDLYETEVVTRRLYGVLGLIPL